MSGLTPQEEMLLKKGGLYPDQNQTLLQKQISQMREEVIRLQEKNQELRIQNKNFRFQMQNYDIEKQKFQQIKNELEIVQKQNKNFGFDAVQAILIKCREMCLGLSPMDLYYKIKDFNPKQLNKKEYLMIQVLEMVLPFQKENKGLRLENSSLKEEINFKNEKLKSQLQQIENLEILNQDKETTYKKIGKRKELGYENMLIELDQAHDQIKELQERLINEQKLQQENNKLKEDLELLRYKSNLYKNQLEDFDKPQDKKELSTYSELQILKNEKRMLESENLRNMEFIKSLEQQLKEQKEDTKESKQKYDKLFEEMLSTQKLSSQNYEKRIQENLQFQKAQKEKDVNEIKNQLQSIYEKQIQYLKEQKEDQMFEIQNIKQELKDKERRLQNLYEENKKLLSTQDTQICEIKVEYRLISEELERKNIELENLKIYKLNSDNEINMLREQLDIVKTEVFKVKSFSSDQLAELKAENQSLRRELDSYNQIEKEIDSGILEVAKNGQNDEFLNQLAQIPTSKNKRILQAVKLGQKLSEKEKQLRQVINEKEELILESELLKKENRTLKNLHQQSKQPGSFLVRSLEEKQQEIGQLEKELFYKKKENKYLKEKIEKVNKQYEDSMQKVQDIEQSKFEILRIKEMLLSLNKKQIEDIDTPKQLDKTLKHPQWVKKLKKLNKK